MYKNIKVSPVRPQSTKNDQLPEQKQHFLTAYSSVSLDKPHKKDVHIN